MRTRLKGISSHREYHILAVEEINHGLVTPATAQEFGGLVEIKNAHVHI